MKAVHRQAWFKLVLVVLLCSLSFAAGGWFQSRRGGLEEKLIRGAYRQIAENSLYNQQSGIELAYAAVRGMLGVTGDAYAELIEPGAASNFMNTFAGRTGVVGLYAENRDRQVVITIVYPDGPAERAGVQVGDVILAIDGARLDQTVDSSEAGLLMRGEPGTELKLRILRGSRELEFNLQREERNFVSARMLPSGAGYLSLTAFNRIAVEQMRENLDLLLAQDPSGLVWDLRNNEGGDMQAAQEILSLFIDDGLLFSASLTRERVVEFRAKGGAPASELPLVVLIDQTSYSAAETCAAAVAETGRGVTLGSATYGKGVIQATIPLEEGAMLQMTIAKWLSPGGEWYDGRGVAPMVDMLDDPATATDELLEKAVDILLAK